MSIRRMYPAKGTAGCPPFPRAQGSLRVRQQTGCGWAVISGKFAFPKGPNPRKIRPAPNGRLPEHEEAKALHQRPSLRARGNKAPAQPSGVPDSARAPRAQGLPPKVAGITSFSRSIWETAKHRKVHYLP